MTNEEWIALQHEWNLKGQAVECTTSQTLGDIKGEIEKLCSMAKCHYPTKDKIIKGLEKIQTLGRAELKSLYSP